MEESFPISSNIPSKPALSNEAKKRIALFLIFGGVILLSIISIVYFGYIYEDGVNAGPPSPSPPPPSSSEKYNLIFLISDGFGPSMVTFARNMDPEKKPLPLDEMFLGVVQTYSSQNLITDSAAGATAYACGIKTYNEAVAVDDNYKAAATSMEAAHRLGMLTGLVATSRITHATPAAFSSHVSDRDNEEEIAYQQAKNQSIDLFFGGGLNDFTNRNDNEDLLFFMEERGYQTIFDINELEKEELKLPIIGLFANSHMDFEIDRIHENPITQPSLSDMTEKALKLLSEKATEEDKTFFLMIEGSRIDMAAHNNDPYSLYLEVQQFLLAIDQVKKFADSHPNTYVISTSDHSTGGMTLGRRADDGSYPIYQWYPLELSQQNASVEVMANLIEDSPNLINETFITYTNISLTTSEFDLVNWAISTNEFTTLKATIGNIISKRANIGWTTPGHTGEDVNLYAYGLIPQNLTGGVMDNTQVAMAYIEEFGFWDTMQEITQELSGIIFDAPEESMAKKKAKHSHDYGHN